MVEIKPYIEQLSELAYGYVDEGVKIEKIFLMGSMEEGIYFFQFFYKKDSELVKHHQINGKDNSKLKLRDNPVFKVLKAGTNILQEIKILYEENKELPPTLIKGTLDVFTKALSYELSYTNQYWGMGVRTYEDVYKEWFEEIRKKETIK